MSRWTAPSDYDDMEARGDPVPRMQDEEGIARDLYGEWIAANYPTAELAYGQCDAATQRMASVFPELTRVRGHYVDGVWGERCHWWLTTRDGTIVDPTAAQFPSAGLGEYMPWSEGNDEPSGKCPNCGGYVYGGGTLCSDTCARAYAAYVMCDRGLL